MKLRQIKISFFNFDSNYLIALACSGIHIHNYEF